MSAEPPVFPRPLEDDDDDVSWALQTALVQWERGGHTDAVVWLRRAGQAAVEAGEFGRAADLERSARSLESWIPRAGSSPPARTPKSLPPPRNPPPVPLDEDDFDGTDEVDQLLAGDAPEIEAFATGPSASLMDALEAEAREQLESDELVSDDSASVGDLGDVEDVEDIVDVDDFVDEPEEHYEESATPPPSRSLYKLPPPPVLPPPAAKNPTQASLDRSVQRPAGDRLGRSERPLRAGERKSPSERPRSDRPPRAELPPRTPRSAPPRATQAPRNPPATQASRNPPVTRPVLTSRVITQRGMPLSSLPRASQPPPREMSPSQFVPEPDTTDIEAMRTQPRSSRPRPTQSSTTEISVVELLDPPSSLEIVPASDAPEAGPVFSSSEPPTEALPSGVLAMLEGTSAEDTPILRPPSVPHSDEPPAPYDSFAPPPATESGSPPQSTYSEIIVESELPLPPPDVSLSAPVPELAVAAVSSELPPPPASPAPPPVPQASNAASGVDVELLASCRGLEDLPPETQVELAARGRLETLAPDQEVSGFGLAIVTRGDVVVMPTIAEAACGYAQRGEPVFSRGNLAEGVALRAVALAEGAEVAVFKSEDFEHMLETCPWVAEELRVVADRFQALAGAAMGPLGDRLDDNMRALVTDRCSVRLLSPGETLIEQGKPVGGLQIIGGGKVEVVRDGSVTGELAAGDLPFAPEVLSHAPAAATLRAGAGGALILEADRMTTHELLVSVPPLLELLATC